MIWLWLCHIFLHLVNIVRESICCHSLKDVKFCSSWELNAWFLSITSEFFYYYNFLGWIYCSSLVLGHDPILVILSPKDTTSLVFVCLFVCETVSREWHILLELGMQLRRTLDFWSNFLPRLWTSTLVDVILRIQSGLCAGQISMQPAELHPQPTLNHF